MADYQVTTEATFAPGDGSSSITGGHHAGPFIDSTGYLYLFLCDSTSPTLLECWRSTDGGQNWSEADSANKPDIGTSDPYGIWGFQLGSVVYLATVGTGSGLRFHTFNMGGTPTWGTKNTVVCTFTDTGGETYISIVALDGGNDIFILHPGEQGATNEKVNRSYSTNGGSNWTSKQSFCDESATYDNDTGLCGYNPDSGNIWGVWRRDDSDYASARYANAVDGTFSSQMDICDFTHNAENACVANSPMPGYMDGTDEVMVWIVLDTSQLPRSVYLVNGSPAASTQVANVAVWKGGGYGASTKHRAALGAAADVDDKSVYCVYADSSTRDLWYVKNTDAGGWGTPVEVVDATQVEALSCALYERDNWMRLGVAFEVASGTDPGNANIRFTEVAIRELVTWEPEQNADEVIRVVSSGRRW